MGIRGGKKHRSAARVAWGERRAPPPPRFGGSGPGLSTATNDTNCHQRHNHPRNRHCNCPCVWSPNAAAALQLRTAQRLAAVLLLGRLERTRERDLKVLCDVVAVGEGAARAEARLGLVRDAVDLRLVVAEQAAAPPPPRGVTEECDGCWLRDGYWLRDRTPSIVDSLLWPSRPLRRRGARGALMDGW